MSPAEHKFELPHVQEFAPKRVALRPDSLEIENDIPVAEVESVHDLTEALALSAVARYAQRNGNSSHPHTA